MSKSPKEPTIILINRNGMGNCPQELGDKLINLYFDVLIANNTLPDCICFYADGVKLAVEDSPVLEVLKALEDEGVRLNVCSTCLNFYGLKDKLRVGQAGDMLGLIENQWRAAKVITL